MAMADNTLISSEHISPPASEDTNYKNGLEDWPALSRQRDSNAPLYSAEFSKARFLYAAVSLERDAVLQSDAEGSGSDYKLAVWRPNSKGVRIRGKPGANDSSAADDHVHLNQYLGQTASQGIFANPAPKVRAVLFRKEDDVLPVGCGHEWWWELWSDGGLAETESITVWQIRGNLVPSSHSCLSPIFFKKTRKSDPVREPPRADEVAGMVLVRWDLVDFVRGEDLKFVWSERGMKLVDNPTGCTIWTTPDGVGTYAFAMPYKVYVGNYPILDWSLGEEVPLHRIVVPPPPPADPSIPIASFRAFLDLFVAVPKEEAGKMDSIEKESSKMDLVEKESGEEACTYAIQEDQNH